MVGRELRKAARAGRSDPGAALVPGRPVAPLHQRAGAGPQVADRRHAVPDLRRAERVGGGPHRTGGCREEAEGRPVTTRSRVLRVRSHHPQRQNPPRVPPGASTCRSQFLRSLSLCAGISPGSQAPRLSGRVAILRAAERGHPACVAAVRVETPAVGPNPDHRRGEGAARPDRVIHPDRRAPTLEGPPDPSSLAPPAARFGATRRWPNWSRSPSSTPQTAPLSSHIEARTASSSSSISSAFASRVNRARPVGPRRDASRRAAASLRDRLESKNSPSSCQLGSDKRPSGLG